MANPEHLQILQQGVEAWNQWRDQHRDIIRVDLSMADLRGANLRGANLRVANLRRANLRGATLVEADLSQANLSQANLREAHLTRVILEGAYLTRATLSNADFGEARINGATFANATLLGANLARSSGTATFSHANLCAATFAYASIRGSNFRGANLLKASFREAALDTASLVGANLLEATLIGTDLTGSYLTGADLTKAVLTEANFTGATLAEADFSEGFLWETIFSNTVLTTVRGLETCRHGGPSTLDHRTLARSGPLPLAFLRGCGLPDVLIDYLPSLLNQPFQFYSCFISYASRDQAFAERLYADLQNKGVRCWYAPEDMKIGDEFRSRIDASIHVHDRLLLILSEHSIKSRWVQKEVETAFEKEAKENRLVLFPIRLDDAVIQIDVGWAADIRRQRHIGDFTRWKEHDPYQRAFTRLLRDLTAAQKPDAPA